MESNKSDVFQWRCRRTIKCIQSIDVRWSEVYESSHNGRDLKWEEGEKEGEGGIEFVSFHPYLCSRSRVVIDSHDEWDLPGGDGPIIPGVI